MLGDCKGKYLIFDLSWSQCYLYISLGFKYLHKFSVPSYQLMSLISFYLVWLSPNTLGTIWMVSSRLKLITVEDPVNVSSPHSAMPGTQHVSIAQNLEGLLDFSLYWEQQHLFPNVRGLLPWFLRFSPPPLRWGLRISISAVGCCGSPSLKPNMKEMQVQHLESDAAA